MPIPQILTDSGAGAGAGAGMAREIPRKTEARGSDRRFVNIMATESILRSSSHRDQLALLETIDAPLRQR